MIAFKYNVASRGREGDNNTWEVMPDINNPEEKLFTDHLEFFVDVTTNEKMGKLADLGFAMVCEGKITYKDYPAGNRQFMIIVPEDS